MPYQGPYSLDRRTCYIDTVEESPSEGRGAHQEDVIALQVEV